MPYKTVVFDLDGTLVESNINYEKMGEQIKELLARSGMRERITDRRKAYQVIRGGAETLLEYGLPRERLTETLHELDNIMNRIELEALPRIILKPNAFKTIQTLHDMGYRLGICTRSHRVYADETLEKFGVDKFFHAVVGRDDTELPKPNAHQLLETIRIAGGKPDETLYIGDTTTDLFTARNANIDFIGYWRNDRWAQTLMDNGCSKLVKDLMDIVKMVKG